MTFAQGNLLRIAFVPEVTPGTTPATPAFSILRATKASGGPKKQTSTSEEMNGNRGGRQVILEGIDVSASYDFELSYGSFDTYLESALMGAWTTNVLKDAATRKYFTIEEADLSGTSAFVRFQGNHVDEFSLSFMARKKITGSMKFFAMTESSASAAISGATYAAASTTEVLSSGASVGSIAVSGLTNQPTIKSLDLTIKNGLGAREKLGSLYSLAPSSSVIEVSGKLMAYFESLELYQAVMAHGTAALSFNVGNVSGSRYTFTLPSVRLVDQDRQRDSFKADQMLSIDYTAEWDPTSSSTISITRGV